VATAVGVAVCARLFLLQGFRVPSRAMEDTVLAGEYLLVDKMSYGVRIPFVRWRLPGWAEPRAGDVVVFEAAHDDRRLLVKRCVAVAGQLVEGRHKVIYVDGRRSIDPPRSKYVDAHILDPAHSPRDSFGPVRVPPDAVFVVGDNRDRSRDSRHWGALPVSAIVGRARRVYWSCEPVGTPGDGSWGDALRSLLTLPSRLRWRRLGAGVR